MMFKRSSRLFLFAVVIFALVLSSCAAPANNTTDPGVPATGETPMEPVEPAPVDETPVDPVEPAPVDETETPVVDETPDVDQTPVDETPVVDETPAAVMDDPLTWEPEEIGGTVTVLAIWGGEELSNFNAMIAPFIEQTGINVQLETTRDLGAVLNTRIQGGNPPDMAGLPNPGQLVALANEGHLVPLDDILDMEGMRQVYDEGFIDLAMVDGNLYGIFTKAAVKSLVWYNPQVFNEQGFQIPETWQELRALEDEMIAQGVTPWCVGIDGGAGSGWPGTDWVEDIMLRTAGPETYDQWWQHEIPWTDDAVVNAFETWGEIVNDPERVYGGQQTVIATNFGQAFVPMFEDPPGCYMHRQASFITTFFEEQFEDLEAGVDYDFFVFPPIEGEYGNPLLVAGDLFGIFNDTPQSRALLRYMVTAEAQAIWAERGGFLSANRALDPAIYPDQITQQMGEMIAQADSVRFDASDLMPEGVNSAFSQGVLQYVSNPAQLQSILQGIESIAQQEYQTQP
jgi:alpha-glucoside transport system substrate-binding protein